jgi:hypothetical protein
MNPVVQSIVTMLRMIGDSRVRFSGKAKNFLFTTASRQALRPMKPSVLWISRASSGGLKQPGFGVDHSPPSSAEGYGSLGLYVHEKTG